MPKTTEILNAKRPMFLPDIDNDVFMFILKKQHEKRMKRSKNTSYAAVICDLIKSHHEYLSQEK